MNIRVLHEVSLNHFATAFEVECNGCGVAARRPPAPAFTNQQTPHARRTGPSGLPHPPRLHKREMRCDPDKSTSRSRPVHTPSRHAATAPDPCAASGAKGGATSACPAARRREIMIHHAGAVADTGAQPGHSPPACSYCRLGQRARQALASPPGTKMRARLVPHVPREVWHPSPQPRINRPLACRAEIGGVEEPQIDVAWHGRRRPAVQLVPNDVADRAGGDQPIRGSTSRPARRARIKCGARRTISDRRNASPPSDASRGPATTLTIITDSVRIAKVRRTAASFDGLDKAPPVLKIEARPDCLDMIGFWAAWSSWVGSDLPSFGHGLEHGFGFGASRSPTALEAYHDEVARCP